MNPLDEQPQQRGGIVNYFQGATIHNIVINGNMSRSGTEYYAAQPSEAETYSDTQIAQAIEAISGKDKPLNQKQLWAAVYWALRWYCHFPVKGSEFCERIEALPFSKELEPACCYDSFRKYTTLSFMNQDARQLDKVRPSRNDEPFYAMCRPVVLALAENLGRTAQPTF